MFKKLLAPVQAWLLNHNQCVGCGRSLLIAKTKQKDNKTLAYCVCGRIFVKTSHGFRRALLEEI